MNFEIYKSKGMWRWRLKAKNGKIIAHGEGYKTKRACVSCVDIISANSRNAKIVYLFGKHEK